MSDENAAGQRRRARLGALTGPEIRFVLAWLCGAAPGAVDDALDRLDSYLGRPRTETAAQATDKGGEPSR